MSAGHLHVGMPSVADIEGVGRAVSARRASVGELIRLAESPPAGLELGGTARATFAVLELAQGAVTEGLVHPQLEYDVRRWFAFWAATLDAPIEQALEQIAAALPEVCAAAFDGDARSRGARSLSVCGRLHRAHAAARGERAADVADAAHAYGDRSVPRGSDRADAGAAGELRVLGARAEADEVGRRRAHAAEHVAVEGRAASRRARGRRARACRCGCRRRTTRR